MRFLNIATSVQKLRVGVGGVKLINIRAQTRNYESALISEFEGGGLCASE